MAAAHAPPHMQAMATLGYSLFAGEHAGGPDMRAPPPLSHAHVSGPGPQQAHAHMPPHVPADRAHAGGGAMCAAAAAAAAFRGGEPQMLGMLHMGWGCGLGGGPAPAQLEDVVSMVIPRRKKKEAVGVPAKANAKPVKIALDVLDRLSCLSLSQAADTLGISSTAMKRSCRKLGVARWPYRSGQAASSNAHIDEAYVRKIQRKYAQSLKRGEAALGKGQAEAAGAAAGVGGEGNDDRLDIIMSPAPLQEEASAGTGLAAAAVGGPDDVECTEGHDASPACQAAKEEAGCDTEELEA